jgi:chromosomal replication initiation ATPase DnaA
VSTHTNGVLIDGGHTREEVMSAREAGPPILRQPDPPVLGLAVQLARVVETAAVSYSFQLEEFVGPGRRDPLVRGRQVGMYVARDLGFSYQMIACAFGRKDHTTVIHAIHRVKGDASMLSEADQLGQYLRTLA